MSTVNQLDAGALVEMGFSRERVEEALKATKNSGIPPALEWLFSHPVAEATSGNRLGGTMDAEIISQSQDSAKEPLETEEGAGSMDTENSHNGNASDKTEEKPQQALSLKCEDCGKQIRSEIDAQTHAARTGHQNFAESTEEIKPLTEEEKKQQRERLQKRLEERRQQRIQEEKDQDRNREISRRRTGKEITQAKEEQAYQEMKRIAEERRREKLEEKRLKQKLKEEIARDRAEMRAKNKPTTSALESLGKTSTTSPQKKDYDSCRIQFRLSNGQTVNSTFKADDTLQSVHLYIAEHRTDGSLEPFTLGTTFPRKTFQSEDMLKSLKELKLVPSSVLVLGKT